MAAPITTTATTLEGQLAEVASALQLAEKAVVDNPQNRVAITFDVDNGELSIQATLPAVFSYSGSMASMSAAAYIV